MICYYCHSEETYSSKIDNFRLSCQICCSKNKNLLEVHSYTDTLQNNYQYYFMFFKIDETIFFLRLNLRDFHLLFVKSNTSDFVNYSIARPSSNIRKSSIYSFEGYPYNPDNFDQFLLKAKTILNFT